MTGPNEQPKHSGISARLFELLKVVFTLVLTGIVGGGITYYYQNRSHREQQEAQELETARQSALTFLREVGDILEQRRHHAFQVLYSVRDNAPPEERAGLERLSERRERVEYEMEHIPRPGPRAVWPGDAEAFLR